MKIKKILQSKSSAKIKAYKSLRAARIAASHYRRRGLLLSEPFCSFIVYRNKQYECYRIALKTIF